MKPDTRWDHLVDTVLWQPPDKSFSKNIIEHGHGISAPREGATCQVVVNQLTDCALDEETCTVKLGVPTEITVGDGDLPIDEIIDKCVESMKRGEVCEVSFPHPAVWRAPPGVSVCGDDGKTVMARSSTAIVPEDNEGTRHPVESEVSAAVADGTSHDPAEHTADRTSRDPAEHTTDRTSRDPAEHTADRTSRDPAEHTTDGTSRDLAERTADAADGASCDPMEHTTNATDRTSRDPSERTAAGTARDPVECSGNITDRTLSEPVEHTADRTARDAADRGDDSARLRLRVSLLDFPDDVAEVWAMTTSDRLRVAARHKHAGVALFHRGALAPGRRGAGTAGMKKTVQQRVHAVIGRGDDEACRCGMRNVQQRVMLCCRGDEGLVRGMKKMFSSA
ncbi:PREDICTED: uncharacterized protein LOC106811483 [Priapulus caudatus]|uniref:Uncharacterized protein LOC106811483 n=1 Tax=Priapulus caudatus TaxID=37621 RepID=A0ABM1EEI7_PRICU|nr:PREDICTED: uncharacterized protein LOC106811483 [Priapulus caudatus]